MGGGHGPGCWGMWSEDMGSEEGGGEWKKRLYRMAKGVTNMTLRDASRKR